MDLPLQQQQPSTTRSFEIHISLEAVLYVVLLAFALTIRLIDLGVVQLNSAESHEALAALHRVRPAMVDTPAVAHNPLQAFVNQLLFFLIEPSNELARIGTALVGGLMILVPYLWRKTLGVTGALVMAGLLAVSPVALAASRTMGGVVWTMTAALLLVWLIQEYYETAHPRFAIAATITASAMLLLTEPTGALTLLAMAFGVFFAYVTSRMDERAAYPQDLDKMWQAWPWRDGIIAAVAVILVIGTGFFTIPDGLTTIGNTIYSLIEGFTTRPDSIPAGFALLTALRYDLGIVVFALISLYFALVEEGFLRAFWVDGLCLGC